MRSATLCASVHLAVRVVGSLLSSIYMFLNQILQNGQVRTIQAPRMAQSLSVTQWMTTDPFGRKESIGSFLMGQVCREIQLSAVCFSSQHVLSDIQFKKISPQIVVFYNHHHHHHHHHQSQSYHSVCFKTILEDTSSFLFESYIK